MTILSPVRISGLSRSDRLEAPGQDVDANDDEANDNDLKFK
jgi:hypothetical protein